MSMQTLDEFFAHPVNPFLPLFKSILRHHQISEEDGHAALIALDEQLRFPNSANKMLYMEWHETLKRLPWHKYPRQALLRPLLEPLSLHPPGKYLETLGDLWPVTFSQLLLDAGLDVEPETSSTSPNQGALDALAIPRSSSILDLSSVVAACGSGIHQGGIAFECKAVQSPGKVFTNIVSASKQLKRHGGGVSAIDVSSFLVRGLGKESPDSVADAERIIEERFRTVLRGLGNPFANRNPYATDTAAIIIYCRALVAPKQLASSDNIFGYADIARYSYILNLRHFAQRERSRHAPVVGQFVEYLMRSVTTRTMATPSDHRPWTIQPNQGADFLVGPNGQLKILRQG